VIGGEAYETYEQFVAASCRADGDHGTVTGNRVKVIANTFDGTFTTFNGETFDVKFNLAQDSNASSEGSFAINGTASFRTSCFSLGTLSGGIFPSGSFIIGRSVALKIETQNGIVLSGRRI
jgi:hypothetical protein